jgi:hypothetical protein
MMEVKKTEYQTRSEIHGIHMYPTLESALFAAMQDETIWKISFSVDKETRIRLVRSRSGWIYEDILGNRMIKQDKLSKKETKNALDTNSRRS